MQKLLIFSFSCLFFLNCKDTNQVSAPTPTPISTKKIFDSANFYGTFEGDLKGKLASFQNNLIRISTEKTEENKFSLKFYSKCSNLETKLNASLIAENKFEISEQTFNNEKISGEGSFNEKNELEISLNSKSILLKANKINPAKDLKFEETKIVKIYPLNGFVGDEITIEGKNLSIYGKIKFDGKQVEMIDISREKVKFIIPETKNEFSEITYSEENCISINFNTKFKLNKNSWKPIEQLAGVGRWYATSFSFQGKGVIGLGMDPNRERLADFWEYNPANNVWQEFVTLETLPRNGAVSFVIHNKVYIGTGFNTESLNDFSELDLTTKKWKEIASIPNGQREHAIAFAANGKGYVMGGKAKDGWKNDVWEFEPQKNEWTKKKNIAGEGRAFMTTMIFGDKILIGGGLGGNGEWNDEWYLYDPVTENWTLKTKFYANEPYGFVIDGTGYCIYDDGKKFAKYDFETDTWRALEVPKELYAKHATLFQIGNKVYYGTGHNGEYSRKFWEYQP